MWISSKPAILFPENDVVSPVKDVPGIFWNKFANFSKKAPSTKSIFTELIGEYCKIF